MSEFPVNINVDAQADLNPTLTGAGKIFSALLPKKFHNRILQQYRHSQLSNAQNNQDIKLIEQGLAEYKDGQIIKFSDNGKLSLSVVAEIEEEENLFLALQESINLCENRLDKPNEEPLSQTFFNKWREQVKLISEDELRNLWAQILVNEVYKPNTVSLRTLEILSVLSKEDAINFTNICKSVCFGGSIIFTADKDKSLYINNINERKLFDLVDLGLIKPFQSNFVIRDNFPKTTWTKLDGEKKEIAYLRYGDYCIFLDISEKLYKDGVTFRELTKFGRELYNLIAKPTIDDISIFVEYFVSFPKNNNQIKNIQVFKYKSMDTIQEIDNLEDEVLLNIDF